MADLIIALDCPHGRALQVLEATRPVCSYYKLGLRALLDYRFALIPHLRSAGARLMLDLKLYDTPDTVRAVIELVARDYQPDLVTVHPSCARDAMIAKGGPRRAPLILSVPLLTSDNTGAPLVDLWAADGVVCPVDEAAKVRRARSAAVIVCPGIRSAGAPVHNHKRTGTPDAAAHAGADFLVVGRPIIDADDPGAIAQAIVAEMNQA